MNLICGDRVTSLVECSSSLGHRSAGLAGKKPPSPTYYSYISGGHSSIIVRSSCGVDNSITIIIIIIINARLQMPRKGKSQAKRQPRGVAGAGAVAVGVVAVAVAMLAAPLGLLSSLASR